MRETSAVSKEIPMTPGQTYGPKPSRFGLTLIEILVAIAILGILAALATTVIQRVRHHALLAACANNMRQIAQAANMYRGDNGGLWPPLQFSSGMSDFTLFAPYVTTFDIFRCPAANSGYLMDESDLLEISDYVYLSDINALFTDNDFNRGHGNTGPFDPGNPVTNRILSWIFGRNQINDYIIYDSSPDHHDGIINVCWLRDTRVEQRDPLVDGLPEMVVLQELYRGTMAHGDLLNSLEIPPGTQLPCLYCGGTGKVMNPSSGKLQNDAACGGTGVITY
ncbi:MAG: type II secretion system protein [Planctomycetota bacterium]|nr:MAG: type II secretion system protein [Planctomycetota bacterium]